MEPKSSLPCPQSPPSVPILSQIIQVHNIPNYLSKIRLNIIHPPSLPFLVVSFFQAFPSITHMSSSSPHSCYIPSPSHPPLLHYSNHTWIRVEVMKLQFPVTSSLFGPDILLSKLFSNTLTLCYPIQVGINTKPHALT
jgi:hypothetical protein